MTIACWRDKMPDGTPVKCGNFDSWEDFLKWDGEKFCRSRCPAGYKGKQSPSGKYLRAKSHPWMEKFNLPFYRRKIGGRKVA